MPTQIELNLSPKEAADEAYIRKQAASHLHIAPLDITEIRIIKKSIDARKPKIIIRLLVDIYKDEPLPTFNFELLKPSLINGHQAIIAGAGPAGLFSALRMLEHGIKPIIIERGKNVKDRRRDLAQITRLLTVNPESNYCFGEGGAGTYSDGKLYTRSGKRGSIERILNLLVKFGADEKILYEAHPHIGTNKLPQIITTIREYILKQGGEIHFNTKLTDIYIDDKKIKGIQINGNASIETNFLVLATGHSARDIFELLHTNNIYIEAKPFALGVRIEHPQRLIDSIQYHCDTRSEFLPPASYSLVDQQAGRGVFSFCMCPGGIIAPAATAPGEIVVNGWSPSKRNNQYANSGMVVSVGPEDFKPWEDRGALAGLYFQKEVEQNCYNTNHSLKAPAQRMIDFVEGKKSMGTIETSYLPGVMSTELDTCLPPEIVSRIRGAMKNFARKMPKYYTNEAVLVAPESRTSSPVRIPRNTDNLQHIHIEGLYPTGEGAGYAGGIVSAAIDGERVADAIQTFLTTG
jgi:uncharacterized FAD-dependent dehydrogenase